eukprot:1180860-Prorocentrum_minimum.AAC.4
MQRLHVKRHLPTSCRAVCYQTWLLIGYLAMPNQMALLVVDLPSRPPYLAEVQSPNRYQVAGVQHVYELVKDVGVAGCVHTFLQILLALGGLHTITALAKGHAHEMAWQKKVMVHQRVRVVLCGCSRGQCIQLADHEDQQVELQGTPPITNQIHL